MFASKNNKRLIFSDFVFVFQYFHGLINIGG